MARHIALLRGINLGARRRVGMAQLCSSIEDLGYGDVSTLLQSGNVVFSGAAPPPAQLAAQLEQRLGEKFGFDIQVVVRLHKELAAVVRANPLADVVTDPKRYLVYFLAAKVAPERLADIDPAAVAPEVFTLRGTEIYLWSPEGLQNARVSKALTEKRLGVVATGRNWSTVEKLLELAEKGTV